MRAGLGRSIALLCRPDGIVLKVFLDELDLGLTGGSLVDVMDPECSAQALDFLRKLRQKKTVFGEKLRILSPHPTTVFFYGHQTLHGLMVFGTTSILRDASAISRLELLAIATHDLKNPVTGILASSQYLLEDASARLDEDHRYLLKSIEASSLFLLRVVDGLLELTQIECGQFQFQFQRTDLQALIDQSLLMNQALARNKGIQINIVSEGPETWINADPSRIGEVVDNLLTNAIKFSRPESTIEVRVSRRGNMTGLAVRDEGPGIPADEVKSVFEPFRRGRTRYESSKAGSGLGLAIVKRIVEGHGGRVEVESEVGRGSTFRVLLPNARKTRESGELRPKRHLVAGTPGASF